MRVGVADEAKGEKDVRREKVTFAFFTPLKWLKPGMAVTRQYLGSEGGARGRGAFQESLDRGPCFSTKPVRA